MPHLVEFGSGQCVLITMQGRPPLCLKCRCVGHVRKDCTSRSWAQVVRGGSVNAEQVEIHPRGGPVSPVAAVASGVHLPDLWIRQMHPFPLLVRL